MKSPLTWPKIVLLSLFAGPFFGAAFFLIFGTGFWALSALGALLVFSILRSSKLQPQPASDVGAHGFTQKNRKKRAWDSWDDDWSNPTHPAYKMSHDDD